MDIYTRNQSIDLIKIVAMLGVMCLHSTGGLRNKEEFGLADILYLSAVISIPLFFMVSGYLVLGRNNINIKYATRKIIGIIRFVFIINILYWLIYIPFYEFNINTIIKSFKGAIASVGLGLIQRGNFYVFWYLGTMCIIYILAIPINKLYNKSIKWFTILLIGITMLESVVFSANLTRAQMEWGGEVAVIQTFRLWNWIYYFMLGGFIKYIKGCHFPLWIIILILATNVVFQKYMSPAVGDMRCEFFYSSIIVAILSVSIFVYLLNFRIKNSFIIKELSSLFLPVYTIHLFIIGYSYKFSHIGGFISPLFYWIFVCISSIAISYLIMKIPLMKNVFRI